MEERFTYFGAWHHIVGLVRGRFDEVTETLTVSKDPDACGVDFTIDSSSISTQNTERDEDLRSDALISRNLDCPRWGRTSPSKSTWKRVSRSCNRFADPVSSFLPMREHPRCRMLGAWQAIL